jgi:hypothetical protein
MDTACAMKTACSATGVIIYFVSRHKSISESIKVPDGTVVSIVERNIPLLGWNDVRGEIHPRK